MKTIECRHAGPDAEAPLRADVIAIINMAESFMLEAHGVCPPNLHVIMVQMLYARMHDVNADAANGVIAALPGAISESRPTDQHHAALHAHGAALVVAYLQHRGLTPTYGGN